MTNTLTTHTHARTIAIHSQQAHNTSRVAKVKQDWICFHPKQLCFCMPGAKYAKQPSTIREETNCRPHSGVHPRSGEAGFVVRRLLVWCFPTNANLELEQIKQSKPEILLSIV